MPKITDPTPEEIAACVQVVEDGGRALAARFFVETRKVPADDRKAKRYVRENWPGFVPEAMRIIRLVFGSVIKEPRITLIDYVMAGQAPPDDLKPLSNYSYEHVLRDAQLLARIHDEGYIVAEIAPDHWVLCRTTPKDCLHDAIWVLHSGQTQSLTEMGGLRGFGVG